MSNGASSPPASELRIPAATYRLQFNKDFTFQQAAGIADYLAELGISDCYASPIFRATPESTHGYDVCDFHELNPVLGGREEFEKFSARLKASGLGLVLDIVPNHMSASSCNRWWLDVLEHGRASRFAEFFDINWSPLNPTLENKVLLPVLEDDYGKVLESGKLRLEFANGKFALKYYEHEFPVSGLDVRADDANLDSLLQSFNGRAGDARSFDALDDLLRRQHYRLANWRIAPEEINYRRFFNVVELVSLRMEREETLEATHKLVRELIADAKLSGLRVDHPDGLAEPKRYFERLSKLRAHYVVVEKILSPGEELPSDWPVNGTTGYDFLNRVNGLFIDSRNVTAFDKIYHDFTGATHSFENLARHGKRMVLERSFVSEINSLTHRLQQLAAISRHGRDFTISQFRAALIELIACFPVYRTYIASDSSEVSEADRAAIHSATRDARQSQTGLRSEIFDFLEHVLLLEADVEISAMREFVMKFQQLTGPAAAKGVEDTAFYNFNRLVSLNEVGGDPSAFGISPDEFHAANIRVAQRWPHTLLASATHDTKRGEDVRARINVLSEIPEEWRDAVARWSQANTGRKMLVDGEPAPDANAEYLLYQTVVGAWPADAGTLEGLKSFRERIAAYMFKAVKEAKAYTRWSAPNPDYELAIEAFTERLLTDNANNVVLDDLRRFHRRLAFFGQFNSLAQTLIKMTSPGVPDFYQGTELWDLNLVDPDNRQPVDYMLRKKMLTEIKREFAALHDNSGAFFQKLLENSQAGASKLFLIWQTLNFRRENHSLFQNGEYVPLKTRGEKSEHVCAFMRSFGPHAAVVIVPRLIVGLLNGAEKLPLGEDTWSDTQIVLENSPSGAGWCNVLTKQPVEISGTRGTTIRVAEALKHFPVALLAQTA